MPVFPLIFHALVAVLPYQGSESWLTLDAGAEIVDHVAVRGMVGFSVAPFAPDGWGGLGEVTMSTLAFGTFDVRGHAGLMGAFGYGRPRSGLWVNFEGGAGVLWGRVKKDEPVEALGTPIASLRVGYSKVAIRLWGFITASKRAVGDGYYALTLEGLWSL